MAEVDMLLKLSFGFMLSYLNQSGGIYSKLCGLLMFDDYDAVEI